MVKIGKFDHMVVFNNNHDDSESDLYDWYHLALKYLDFLSTG